MEELPGIIMRSIMISGTATLLSTAWSLPLTIKLSLSKHPLKESLMGILNSLVGFPTVLVGLLLYLVFSSSGPLGMLRLIYTPQAIIIGEALLITPLMMSLLYEVVCRSVSVYWELAISLGASKRRATWFVMEQTLPELMIVLLMSFSRAIGELGVALLVGGNIKGFTRVITTSIALAIEAGEFDLAVFLGMVLLTMMILLATTVRLLRAWLEK
ncbi:MAG: ABC transporter substrate-binding protein [Thermoprotei archaeon]|nr:MAG: ABC transporter substrate-binding protein [Thermoprotei archaeon]